MRFGLSHLAFTGLYYTICHPTSMQHITDIFPRESESSLLPSLGLDQVSMLLVIGPTTLALPPPPSVFPAPLIV